MGEWWRRTFVDEENRRPLEEHARGADELPLTGRQISAVGGKFLGQGVAAVLDAQHAAHLRGLEGLPNLAVCAAAVWVEVLAQRALEDETLLREGDDVSAEAARRDLGRVGGAYCDAAVVDVDEASDGG